MDAATLKGFRMVADEMASVVSRTMTAKEMALVSHNLGRDGKTAVTADGRKWVWDARFSQWAAWG
jgi:hypothetical protein